MEKRKLESIVESYGVLHKVSMHIREGLDKEVLEHLNIPEREVFISDLDESGRVPLYKIPEAKITKEDVVG